jgi:hypothetical protein
MAARVRRRRPPSQRVPTQERDIGGRRAVRRAHGTIAIDPVVVRKARAVRRRADRLHRVRDHRPIADALAFSAEDLARVGKTPSASTMISPLPPRVRPPCRRRAESECLQGSGRLAEEDRNIHVYMLIDPNIRDFLVRPGPRRRGAQFRVARSLTRCDACDRGVASFQPGGRRPTFGRRR